MLNLPQLKKKTFIRFSLRQRLYTGTLVVSDIPAVGAGRSRLDGVAGEEGVAPVAVVAGADGNVPPGGAAGVHAALATGAGVLAGEVDAGPVVRALGVGGALASTAAGQGVAEVAVGTGADGPLLAGVVVARAALGVLAAGVRRAEVLCGQGERLCFTG